MIIVVKKNNIILIGLVFLLLITVFSLNIGGDWLATASGKDIKRIVILDPGHGGEDPGKVSNYTDLKEKDVNLKIALNVKKLLEKDNYVVIITREEDKLEYTEGTTNIIEKRRQDLTRRKKLMDENGAAIVVSIHLNGFPQTQYYGAQTFYPPDSPDSQKLANSLQKSLKENVDPENNRQPQLKKDPIIILNNLKTPTAIVECGFLSNAEEEKKLATEEYQAKLAVAIKSGIDNYFK